MIDCSHLVFEGFWDQMYKIIWFFANVVFLTFGKFSHTCWKPELKREPLSQISWSSHISWTAKFSLFAAFHFLLHEEVRVLLTWQAQLHLVIWHTSRENRPLGLCRCHTWRRIGGLGPRQSFFGYDTDYKTLLYCLHRWYSVVGVIPKEELVGPQPANPSSSVAKTKTLRSVFPWHPLPKVLVVTQLKKCTKFQAFFPAAKEKSMPYMFPFL